jgi:hypothetical protein
MVKVVTGVLLRTENPSIKRGELTFAEIEFRADDGKLVTWKNLSMSREVAGVLGLGQPITLYLSPLLGSLFGARPGDGPGAFKADSANPVFLLMAVGMIFLGLGTSMFLFPLLIALGGAVGVVLHLQAASARRRFRRDGKRLTAGAPAHA